MSSTRAASLEQVLEECWARLEEGARDPGSACRRAVLGTGPRAGCRLRTVILRAVWVSERVLICHTDRRSAKVVEIDADPAVGWLFFDPAAGVQMRVEGRAQVHRDDCFANDEWRRVPAASRRPYLVSPAPGSRRPRPTSGLPSALEHREPTGDELERAQRHFAVVRGWVERLEWLQLGDRGHTRARFEWSQDGFEASWLVP